MPESHDGEARETPGPIDYGRLAPKPPEGELDLDALVPGEGPLELDIGFGRGLSLLRRAESAPDRRLLGIEIKAKWVTKVDRRLRRLELDRVTVWAGDAREILARAGPDGSVARAFVHFPDPWWKKRHQKRRMVSDGLLDALGRLLAAEGELFLQTDVEDRAAAFVEQLRAHPAFELAGEGGYLEDNPFGILSNRERRASEDGLPVYRILARRCDSG